MEQYTAAGQRWIHTYLLLLPAVFIGILVLHALSLQVRMKAHW